MISWFIVRNAYLDFIHGPGVELLKILVLSDESDKGVFLLCAQGDFWTPPEDGRWLLGEPSKWSEVRAFSPIPLRGGGRVWRPSSITSGQRFNQSRLGIRSPEKWLTYGLLRALQLVNTWSFGDSGAFSAWKLFNSTHIPCPSHLFHLAVLEL